MKFIYSDVGFIVLGDIVERVSGKTLDAFSRERVFKPLGMTKSGFNPGSELKKHAAPTQERKGNWMQGEVHDPRAYRLGGVAGHAGLFSTAQDPARYAQMLLNDGVLGDTRILKPETLCCLFVCLSFKSATQRTGERRVVYLQQHHATTTCMKKSVVKTEFSTP